jgi:hypothetical protein
MSDLDDPDRPAPEPADDDEPGAEQFGPEGGEDDDALDKFGPDKDDDEVEQFGPEGDKED